HARPLAVDAMAGATRPLALEERLAALRSPDFHGGAAQVEAGANERDEPVDLGGLQLEPRHTGPWDAGRDDIAELLIGHRPAELSPAKIDSRNAVAGRTVAQRALTRIQARAGFDVYGAVLARMVLGRALRTERSAYPCERGENAEQRMCQPFALSHVACCT